MSNMSNVVATPQSSADLSGDVSTISSAATGMVITMNAFIDPSNQAAYLQALRPILKALGENPENIFVVVSVSPKDAGHVRVMHGWKKDSAWFNEVLETPNKGAWNREGERLTVLRLSISSRIFRSLWRRLSRCGLSRVCFLSLHCMTY